METLKNLAMHVKTPGVARETFQWAETTCFSEGMKKNLRIRSKSVQMQRNQKKRSKTKKQRDKKVQKRMVWHAKQKLSKTRGVGIKCG